MTDLVKRARAALEGVTEGPWTVNVHQSGSTNVVMRTGDCWNEHGPGMLYAPITLYNMGAYSEGATDDGVQLERHRAATFIAASRTLVPELVAEVERLRGDLEATAASLDDAECEIKRLRELAHTAFAEGHGFGLSDGHPLRAVRDTDELWREESWVRDEIHKESSR